MQDFPHRYHVTAAAAVEGDVGLSADRLPELRSASPAEFGGLGNRWSPETLLTGAVADCFILTFRAIARASKLPWTTLRCEVTGTLERVERVTQFTAFELRVRLTLPTGVDEVLARRALDKAEHNCLVSNSLKAAVHLQAEIEAAAGEPVHA